jgi:hypothetical protein
VTSSSRVLWRHYRDGTERRRLEGRSPCSAIDGQPSPFFELGLVGILVTGQRQITSLKPYLWPAGGPQPWLPSQRVRHGGALPGRKVERALLVLEHGDALARRVFHPLAGIDVAEQEIAAFLPPQRPFGRSERPAEALAELEDRLGRGDDSVEFRRKFLDSLGGLRRRRPMPLPIARPPAADIASMPRREIPLRLP